MIQPSFGERYLSTPIFQEPEFATSTFPKKQWRSFFGKLYQFTKVCQHFRELKIKPSKVFKS
ncbi:hypothetical protein B9G53_05580 [Pseudanabaena sp. SR411]|nr:hypothetical protein B9G53_05580 [Pseudanabaena sp. SR411]